METCHSYRTLSSAVLRNAYQISPHLCVLSRLLRSASDNLLTVPRTTLAFGSRAVRASAPTVWIIPSTIALATHKASRHLNGIVQRISSMLPLTLPHSESLKCALIMAALCNRADRYIFVLWFLSFYLSDIFCPRLISAATDWMSTIGYTCRGPSANLECRSEMCCTRHWPTFLVLF